MLRLITFLITIPISLFVLWFAVSNTHDITISLMFIGQDFTLPAYAVILGLMALGFLAGCLLVWLNLYGYRIKYWRASRNQPKLEAEIDRLKAALEEKEAELKKIPQPYAPGPSQNRDRIDNRLTYFDN